MIILTNVCSLHTCLELMFELAIPTSKKKSGLGTVHVTILGKQRKRRNAGASGFFLFPL
jgi:hypothetical protein